MPVYSKDLEKPAQTNPNLVNNIFSRGFAGCGDVARFCLEDPGLLGSSLGRLPSLDGYPAI